MARLNENSTGVKVEGYKGTWYVIVKDIIKDGLGRTKTVYVLEHERYGEDAEHLFVDYTGKIIEIFEGIGELSSIKNWFSDYSFAEAEKDLIAEREAEKQEEREQKPCKTCSTDIEGNCFCDNHGYCKF